MQVEVTEESKEGEMTILKWNEHSFSHRDWGLNYQSLVVLLNFNPFGLEDQVEPKIFGWALETDHLILHGIDYSFKPIQAVTWKMQRDFKHEMIKIAQQPNFKKENVVRASLWKQIKWTSGFLSKVHPFKWPVEIRDHRLMWEATAEIDWSKQQENMTSTLSLLREKDEEERLK